MDVLNVFISPGWGMTETTSGLTFQRKGDTLVGCCGEPMPYCSVKVGFVFLWIFNTDDKLGGVFKNFISSNKDR